MEGIDTAVLARKTVGEFVRQFPDESQRAFIEKRIQDWQRADVQSSAIWAAIHELREELKALRAGRDARCEG